MLRKCTMIVSVVGLLAIGLVLVVSAGEQPVERKSTRKTKTVLGGVPNVLAYEVPVEGATDDLKEIEASLQKLETKKAELLGMKEEARQRQAVEEVRKRQVEADRQRRKL